MSKVVSGLPDKECHFLNPGQPDKESHFFGPGQFWKCVNPGLTASYNYSI